MVRTGDEMQSPMQTRRPGTMGAVGKKAKSAAETSLRQKAEEAKRRDAVDGVRQERVIELLQETVKESTVVRQVSVEFDVGLRQARTYVRKAWEAIREERGETREFDAERMEELFEEIATRALKRAEVEDEFGADVKALQVANIAADRLAKIRGVYKPDKVEHSGELGPPLGITTPDQARARLQELLAARKRGA